MQRSSASSLAVKVMVAVASGIVGLAVAVDRLEPFLTRNQRVYLVVAASVIAIGSSVAGAVGEYRSRQAEAHQDDAGFLLRGGAWAISDLTGIDVRDLGLAVYQVRREPILRWRQYLARVRRERAMLRPEASGVVWRPGKGVIGKCVQDGVVVGQDRARDEAPWLNATLDDWKHRVPEHVRSGLTYDEFRRTRGKYHVVIASPVTVEGRRSTRTVGCVALDGPAGSYARLWSDDVKDVLTDLGRQLERFVL